MSEFKTILKVDVQSIIDLLPKHQVHIHGVEFDKEKKEVAVRWSTPNLETPYSFPVDFPIENLKHKKLPKGVLTRKESKEQKEIRKNAEAAAKARAANERKEADAKRIAAKKEANAARLSKEKAEKAAAKAVPLGGPTTSETVKHLTKSK